MKVPFFNIVKQSLLDLVKSPAIIGLSLLALLFTIIFSRISVKINYLLQSYYSLTSWIILYVLVILLVLSLVHSLMIGLSINKINPKKKQSISYYSKFWWKNFLIIIFILLVYNASRFIAHISAFYLGKIFSLDARAATLVFFIMLFAVLAGVILFLAFSGFYLILHNSSIVNSIRGSIRFVKKNYPETLAIIIFFFALNELLAFLQPLAVEIINAVIVVPFLTLLLTRFLMFREK